ncbi:hypothetical protein AWH62_11995 [Maricaulis sp. W15]|nr:hypothetical protein AWH62_11995 [Maricaulis sp. W15]
MVLVKTDFSGQLQYSVDRTVRHRRNNDTEFRYLICVEVDFNALAVLVLIRMIIFVSSIGTVFMVAAFFMTIII